MRSATLGNERSIWISPPNDPSRANRLIIFLDAELYREKVGAPAIVDALRSTDAVADSWCVFVSYETVESRWKECPCFPPFVVFVVDELLPFLGSLHAEIARCDRRTLIGLSYTGLAAAYVAHERPRVFDHVIAQSASFWWNDCWLIRDVAARPMSQETAFWLEVGERETQTELHHRPDVFQEISQIEGVRRFYEVLREQGCRVAYRPMPGGAHDTTSWAKTLPDALRWASDQLTEDASAC